MFLGTHLPNFRFETVISISTMAQTISNILSFCIFKNLMRPSITMSAKNLNIELKTEMHLRTMC
jgi:hypothetical protein